MFKIGKMINDLSNKIYNDTILTNPINVAIIITLLVMIIIYFITYDEIEPVYEDQTLGKLWVKIGFFAFLSNIIVLFFASNNISNKYKAMYQSKTNQQAVKYTNLPMESTVKPE